MMRRILITLGIVLPGFWAVAVPVNEPVKYLVSAEKKVSSTTEQLQENYAFAKQHIRNGFSAYKITYRTGMGESKTTIASGAVFVPDTEGALPILNYNHGTIFPSQERNAPSYLNPFGGELAIAKLFAANGYLVALPDYIGYGATKDEKHPYGAYQLIANSSVDMMRAVLEFCKDKKLKLSGKNFFSGWSEGAAVALAVVKQLENEPGQFMKPTATVLNAGPYYSSAFVDHVLDATTSLRYLKTYVWVLNAYNWVYNINKPLSYYFNEPYATEMEKDGITDLPSDPRKVFSPAFRDAYKSGKVPELKAAFQANDLWNWKPKSPVVFCHGDKDDYVPLFNSEKAYNEMKALGADVTLHIFKGQNHSSGAFNFIQVAFESFEKLK